MTVYFEDDFESGNFNNWTTVNAAPNTSIAVSSVWAKQCTKSALFENKGLNGVMMYLQKSLSSAVDEAFFRFYFKFSALTIASSGFVQLAGLRSASGTIGQLRLVPQGGNNCLQLSYSDSGTVFQKQSTTQILVDTVYCLELHFKRGAGNAEVNVYLDGALVSDLAVSGININVAASSVLLGYDANNYPGAGNDFELFYDCVVVSDSYIGLLSSGFTVVYDGNGNTSGTVPVDGNSPYLSGSTVTVLGNSGNLAINGYYFDGWSTDPSSQRGDYQQGNKFTIAGNTTLYAIWVSGGPPQNLSVTYNGNGNTGGNVPSHPGPFPYGALVTVLGNTGNLVKTGYTFLGWSTNSSATSPTYVAGSTFNMPAYNVVLYAVWSIDSGFDGGTVNKPISINDDWLNLYFYTSHVPNPPDRLDWTVKAWMFQYSKYPRGLPPGADKADNIGLRFIDKNRLNGWYTNVYGAVIRNESKHPTQMQDGAPAFCVSDIFLYAETFTHEAR